MSLAFLSKKTWHTSTLVNQEKVWIAQQKDEEEKRRIKELQKQVEEERQVRELQEMHKAGGHAEPTKERIDWMYEGPMQHNAEAEAKAAEEYLMGKEYKPVDKDTSELKKIEESGAPGGLFVGAPQATSANEAFRRVQEDPLLRMRRAEMQAKESVASNPVKMERIRKQLEQEMADKREKKRAKKEAKKEAKKAKKEKHKEKKRERKEKAKESKSDGKRKRDHDHGKKEDEGRDEGRGGGGGGGSGGDTNGERPRHNKHSGGRDGRDDDRERHSHGDRDDQGRRSGVGSGGRGSSARGGGDDGDGGGRGGQTGRRNGSRCSLPCMTSRCRSALANRRRFASALCLRQHDIVRDEFPTHSFPQAIVASSMRAQTQAQTSTFGMCSRDGGEAGCSS